MRRLALVTLLALFVAAAGAPAQSITTLYATNNGGSAGGAVYFDVTILAGGGLIITSFDINNGVTVGLPVTIDVYTAPLTYQGNEAIPSMWTHVANGTGTAAGIDVPTPIDTTDFTLFPGTYGLMIICSGNHKYTGTGTGPPTAVYANSDISLLLGAALNVPWTGTPFSPRVFNGSIYYAPNQNILSVSQSGPGVGDLTMSLTNISGTAFEGWTLLSEDTSGAVGTGPFLGLIPDGITWSFLAIPYFVGNPIHFRTYDVGFYPNIPLYAGPGQVSVLNGHTLDFVTLLITNLGQYDSRSNVVRHTFQ